MPRRSHSAPSPTDTDLLPAVDAAFREESGRVMGHLMAVLGGDLGTAEEALQDAFVLALERWPIDGVPARPGAWITTVARRRAIDRLRRARMRVDREADRALEPAPSSEAADPAWLLEQAEATTIPDDRLRLMFTCCHLVLSPEARVALTLRVVAGLQVPAIARAFLVPEATLAQRLVRAKRTLRTARVPYQVPDADELPTRLASVLLVVYLVFTEGYRHGDAALDAMADPGRRAQEPTLTQEAIRLGRLLTALLPDDPEVHGLLALMLLQEARRPARLDDAGELVLLEDQDRSRWDRAAIDEGGQALVRAMRLGPAGPYQLQAAIALEHDLAPDAAQTDWAAIRLLYERLDAVAPSPVVALNHAVAVAMIDGPEAALARVAAHAGDARMRAHPLYDAVRADLLRRAGDRPGAAAAYRAALARAADPAERRYLERRLAGLGISGRTTARVSAARASATRPATTSPDAAGSDPPAPRP
ncbi:MAG: RNA polymerase sigma factor [Chloroflexi bacterium]|nr:RNA polymerase sigma factor [Chloroflexota bacterium]